jgi:hypothetical protein
MNQPFSKLGFKNVFDSLITDEDGAPSDNEKKQFPVNYPPNILDTKTNFDNLNLTALDSTNGSNQ